VIFFPIDWLMDDVDDSLLLITMNDALNME